MNPTRAHDPDDLRRGAATQPMPSGEAGEKALLGETLTPPEGSIPNLAALTGLSASHSAEEVLPRDFGRYRLLDRIGRGGMGVVYKARQAGLDRIVALKTILPGPDHGDGAARRFQREARAASALDHPNLVPIHDWGEELGQQFYTMAYIEGPSLQGLRLSAGPPSFQRIAALVAGAADGVEYAHAQGFVHRDLKPENVLVDPQGRPRVLDFGLARRIEDDQGLTAPGQVMGTPRYMAPEQAQGDNELVGPRTDVYALGGILYYLLTGGPPFEGHSTMDTLLRVLQQPATPPRQINPAVPEGLSAICLKCLEKDPQKRYQSARALAEALRGWMAGAQEATDADSPRLPEVSGSSPSATDVLPAPAQPAPAPTLSKGRGFLVAAAGVAVLGLAVGALLIQPWKAAAPTGQSQAEGPTGTTAAEPPPAPLLPAQLRRDFPLKVELVGGKRDETGRYVLNDGEDIAFRVEPEKDAYVAILNFTGKGDVVQLFPNGSESTNLIRAGEKRLIDGGEFRMTASFSGKPESVRIIASTKPWEPLRSGSRGHFEVFRGQAQEEQIGRRLRDIVLVPRQSQAASERPQAAEEELHLYVQKRP